MLANLSSAILYYYCVKNNIYIPIIIPFFIGLRSFVLLQPDDSILKKFSFLQDKEYANIEYYSSIIISIMIIFYLYVDDEYYKNTLTITFGIIIALYILLLILNFIYLKKNELI